MSHYLADALYPVIAPQEAIVLDLFLSGGDPLEAVLRAKSLRTEFRRMSESLETQILMRESATHSSLYEKAMGPFLSEGKQLVVEALMRLSREMFTGQTVLRQMEETRATAISVDLAHDAATGSTTTYKEQLHRQSTGFIRLLGELAETLNTVPGFGYEAHTTRTDQAGVLEMDITQLPDGTPLISGQRYAVEGWLGESGRFYTLSWPVFCSDEQFIRGIQQCVKLSPRSSTDHAMERRSRRAAQLIPIHEDDDLWWQGVIVTTGDKNYGVNLEAACGQGDWPFLRLSNLATSLPDGGKAHAHPVGHLPSSIQQLSVNTLFGDFICDIVPGDSSRRLVTVVSHYNLAAQVVRLYECTGTTFCLRGKMLNALHELLDKFPMPSDPHTHGQIQTIPYYAKMPSCGDFGSVKSGMRKARSFLRRSTANTHLWRRAESGGLSTSNRSRGQNGPVPSVLDPLITARPHVAPKEKDISSANRPEAAESGGDMTKLDSPIVTWVHISDLHIFPPHDEARAFNQAQVLEKFLCFFSSDAFRALEVAPNFLFATGDLAFQGATADYLGPAPQGYTGRDVLSLLRAVATHLHLPVDHVFTVPGNHDANRGAVGGRDIARAQLKIARNCDELVRLLYDQSRIDERMLVLQRFKAYHEFWTKLRRKRNSHPIESCLWTASTAPIPESNIKVGIVGLCSALFSQSYWKAHLADTDERSGEEPRGFLALCERKVMEMLDVVAGCDLVVALTHHPPKYLSDADRWRVMPHLQQRANFILCGHIHHDEYWAPPLGGQAHTILAGSLFEERDHHRNAFNIVEVDIHNAKGRMVVVHWDRDDWSVDRNAIRLTQQDRTRGYNFDPQSGIFHFPL